MSVPRFTAISGSVTGWKRKRVNDEYGYDFISGLPDDILLHLLSFTDTRTAAKTSILSKRWRHVWTCLTHLNIEAPILYPRYLYRSYMDRYCNWINKAVSSYRAPYLDTFRIDADLDESYAAHLKYWLEFALVKQVRNLELNFRYNLCSINTNRALGVNTTLECLNLTSVTIDEPFLGWILSYCHNLQRLSFHNCKIISRKSPFASSVSTKLVISSLSLKHLEFFNTLSASFFRELHLSASNLAYFMFGDSEFVKVVYHKVPSLVDANFPGTYSRRIFQNMDNLSGFSSQLEKLCLFWDAVCSISIGFLTFANVKKLEITVDSNYHLNLFNTISLIEACPMLHTFKLKLMVRRQALEFSSAIPNETQINVLRNHQHLRALEFDGFCGDKSIVWFTHCLIANTPMLKKITLDPRPPVVLRTSIKEFYGEDAEKLLEQARYCSKIAACDFRWQGVEEVVVK